MVACWQRLSYSDASDRSDKNFQISETSLDDSFKDFCLIILQEFGQEYLNQSPMNDEIKRTLRVNIEQRIPWIVCIVGLQAFPMGYVSNGRSGSTQR